MAVGGFGGLGDILLYLGVVDAGYSQGLAKAQAETEAMSKKIDKVMNTALLAGAAAFVSATVASAQFESSFAGVTKTVDGLRDPMGNLTNDGEKLAREFRNIALEIPISVNELNKIGELGGQLGIPKESLIDFTETIAQLGVTTNLTIEEGSTALARFVNITQQVAPTGMNAGEQISRIGSTIVDLGNNMATTEQDIVNFGMRIAGAGAQVGLSQSEILAMGAALSSVGLNAEAGGTAISKLMIDMANEVATGGDKLALFAQIAGISVDEFKNKFETDAAGAITMFISGMGNMSESGENVFGTLEELGYTEIRLRDAILRSSAASDLLTESFQIGNRAYEENNALQKEAAQRFGTTQSQLELLKNIFYDAFIEIGNNFLPVINDILKALNEHPEAIQNVIKVFSEFAIIIATVVAGYKIYQAGAKAVQAVNLLMTSSFGPIALVIAGAVAAFVAINAAFEAHEKAILNEIDAVSDNVESIEKLENEYVKLKDKVNPTAIEQERLKEITDELTVAYEDAKKGTGDYSTSLDDLIGKYRELKLEQLKDKQKELNDEVDKATVRSGAWWGILNGLGNAIGRTSLASDIYSGSLEKLEKQQDAINKEITELETNQKSLNAVGITTEKQVRDEITALEALLAATKPNTFEHEQLTEKINGLKEKIGEAVPVIKDLKSNEELLKEAGVKTTESLQGQIDEYKKILPLIKDDNYATGELKNKIDELNKELIKHENWDEYNERTKDANDKFQALDITTESVRGKFAKIAPLIGKVAENIGDMTKEEYIAAMKDIDNLAETSNDNWVEYAKYLEDIAGKFNILGPVGKDALGLISTAMTGAFDPVTFGLNAINLMIKAYNEMPPAVIDANKLAKESLGELYDEIQLVKTGFEELAEKYDSDLIQGYIDKIKDLEEQYKLAAFQAEVLDQSVTDFYDSNEKATGSMAAGTGAADKFRAQMQELSGELEKTTEEMNDLLKAFTSKDNYDTALSNLKDITEASKEMIDLFGDIDTSGLNTMLNEAIQSSVELLGTLDPTSQAYGTLAEQIYLAYQQLVNMGGSTEPLRMALFDIGLDLQDMIDMFAVEIPEAVNETTNKLKIAGDGIDDFGKTLPPIITNIDDLTESIEENIYDVEDMDSEWQKLNNTIDETTDSLYELVVQWDETLKAMTGTYTEFEKSVKEITEMIQQILFFNIDLDTTDMDEKIGQSIILLQDYLKTLDPDSEAYRLAKEAIDDLIKQFLDMGGNIFDVTNDINLLKEYLWSLRDNDININLNYNTKGDPTPTFHGGGAVLHGGGFAPRYHYGFMSNNEVAAILERGEFVLQKNTASKFNASDLMNFNVSGDPSALMGDSNQNITGNLNIENKFDVTIHSNDPDAWIEITDKKITPRVNRTNRNFVVGNNPYNI